MRDSGEQCVMTTGGPMMLKWHAGQLGFSSFGTSYVITEYKFTIIMYNSVMQEQPTTRMPTLVVELDPYSWAMWDVLEENQDY